MTEDRVGAELFCQHSSSLLRKGQVPYKLLGACLLWGGCGGVQVAPAIANFSQMVLTMLVLRAAFWGASC